MCWPLPTDTCIIADRFCPLLTLDSRYEVIEFFVLALGHTSVEGCTVVATVEQVTGRPPRTFAHWAAEHADVFR